MKKIVVLVFALIIMLFSTFAFAGCGIFGSSSSNDTKVTKYEKELESSTGKWYFSTDTSTYFEFDGSKNSMTFKYVENGTQKYTGKYTVVYQGNNGTQNSYTFAWCLKNGDNDDVLTCYADDFETDFTQFTIMKMTKKLPMNDGRNYDHIYRISEQPYKMGTYILEGNQLKKEREEYCYADRYQIPPATYILDSTTSITFVMPKNYHYALFSYRNGDEIVEGVYYTHQDKKTIYLFIEHDPYEYIRKEDRSNYDMTFSHDYPPDFYLRGDFEVKNNCISITSLYHHEYSPTQVQDSVWKFGNYELVTD
ncbi:MAG: hypothetical protein J5656_02580 [Clostridia bacterium]|nr:hypothetical protein [Clostridia bacterium]